MTPLYSLLVQGRHTCVAGDLVLTEASGHHTSLMLMVMLNDWAGTPKAKPVLGREGLSSSQDRAALVRLAQEMQEQLVERWGARGQAWGILASPVVAEASAGQGAQAPCQCQLRVTYPYQPVPVMRGLFVYSAKLVVSCFATHGAF